MLSKLQEKLRISTSEQFSWDFNSDLQQKTLNMYLHKQECIPKSATFQHIEIHISWQLMGHKVLTVPQTTRSQLTSKLRLSKPLQISKVLA